MELSYNDKVFAALQKMVPGKPLVISKTVKSENREAFIASVCMAIDLNWCGPEYMFEFDNDYTEVRKLYTSKSNDL